jgi:hypothetical protein
MRKLAFHSILLVTIVLFTGSVVAVERLVPSEYPNIQAAIDDCNNDDVVIVEPNIYTGSGNKNLDFGGSAITVRSTDPNDPNVVAATVIDCQNSGRGFYFHSGEDTNSIISGLTITNGRASGGGIYCSGSSPTIENCIITNNAHYASGPLVGDGYDGYGGGIYCGSISNPIITGCTISYNTAKGGQGGDEIFYHDPPELIPAGNGGDGYGGGIYSSSDSGPMIVGCNLTNNEVIGGNPGWSELSHPRGGNGHGGGIYGYGNISINNCVISNNHATGGNGVEFYADRGAGFGGGVEGNGTIKNCLISSNEVSDGSFGGPPPVISEGGGIKTNSSTISNCTITGNAGIWKGYGIYGTGSTIIVNCIIWDNYDEYLNRDDLYGCSATYSCISDADSGTGVIHSDPCFVSGPEGDYYLSQISAGQAVDSLCVDAGSDTAANLEMDISTTRTDHIGDAGTVDMGYHYPKAIVRSADIDENWHVDFIDFAILAGDWDRCSEPCDSNMLPGNIFLPDWCVDFNDLAVLVDCWLDCYVASAKNPTPSGNATGVNPNIILNWTPGAGAVSHDVYFGTDHNGVNNATIDSNEYMGNQDTNSWDPNSYDSNGLAWETTYHWRIDSVGARCESKGDVWSFTTWVDPTLVSRWEFDEGEGDIAYDSAGDNDGTLVGDTNWVTGKIGDYALEFDGDGDYVEVPAHSSINQNSMTKFSAGAWIYPKTLGGFNQGRIISKRFYGYDFYIYSSGNLEVYIPHTTTSAQRQTDSGNAFSLDEWTYVAFTYNEDNDKKIKIYANGVLQTGGTDIAGDGSLCDDSFDSLKIGRYYYSAEPRYFDGKIDDVRIYDRALSAGDIWQLYREGLSEKAFAPSPEDGKIDVVDPNVVLSWSPGKNVLTHDVYFGTDFNEVDNANTSSTQYMGNQNEIWWDTNNYDSNGLEPSTTFYWRIDEVNDPCVWKGDVWSFTTLGSPYKSTNPNPANNATEISLSSDLSWTAGLGATSHDVYFGTSSPGTFCGNQTGTTYDPGILTDGKTYYWRIDEKNAAGTTTGDVWSFTTWVDPNLVSRWEFDEGDGTTAYDSAGDNNGTLVGDPCWVSGKVGNYALDFDGNGDYVQVPDDNSLTPSDALTISAWIYINEISWSDRTAIVCKYYSSGGSKDRAYIVELGKNGEPDNSTVCISVSQTTNPFNGKQTCGTTQLQAGQWYHIATTFEPDHQEVYVDGIEETDDTDTAIADFIANNDQPLYIGFNKEENTYFDGTIDDVRIYNRALSAGDIWQLYQGGLE